MKNILKTSALALVLAGSLASCDDFLTVDPVDKPVMENYFTSPEALQANTKSLYVSHVWWIFHNRFQWELDLLAGDIYYTYDAEGQFYFGSFSSANPYVEEGWRGLYNVILFANSVINDVPATCGGSITQADITQAIAEARGIRGFCYYMIAELWHDAPIIENNSDNITSGNLDTPRNTRANLYRFALEDLDFAVDNLAPQATDDFRLNVTKARGLRSKLLTAMASHTDMGYDRADLYGRAAADALYCIENTQALTDMDYSTLFDPTTNNGPESLLAVQCGAMGFRTGSSHCDHFTRTYISDSSWGDGKGPTIALQQLYNPNDLRRKWVYMTLGDEYPTIERAKGGYTYQFIHFDDSGKAVAEGNEVLAHIKKYVLGRVADWPGQLGTQQDAGNNIYLLRLADVYLTYVEAVMGAAESTTDATALKYYNMVRQRAGLPQEYNSLSYRELLDERRRELAFEGQTWFDMQRFCSRYGAQAAAEYLNGGFGTGYNRASMYVANTYPLDKTNGNDRDTYRIVGNIDEGANYDPINFSASSFDMPIPGAASTASPALLGPVVDYYEGR